MSHCAAMHATTACGGAHLVIIPAPKMGRLETEYHAMDALLSLSTPTVAARRRPRLCSSGASASPPFVDAAIAALRCHHDNKTEGNLLTRNYARECVRWDTVAPK